METHEFDKIDLLSYVTGGCDETKSERISTHLLTCRSCRSSVEAFRSENAAFLNTHPYAGMTQTSDTVPIRRTVPFPMRRIYGIAASILLLLSAGYFLHLQEDAPSSQIKGAVGLKLFVKNARGEIEMRDKHVYCAGERIQFQYSCGIRNKFMLLSIDTTGAVMQYYPVHGDSSEALEPGQDIPLPHSILLDEYSGRELFIGIFSEKKLRADHIRDEIKADFNRTNNIDSIGLSMKDVSLWNQRIVVIKGTR